MNTEERLIENHQKQIILRNHFNNVIDQDEVDRCILELNRLEEEENELYRIRKREVISCL